MPVPFRIVALLFATMLLFGGTIRATETENYGVQILPVPGKVTIDGNFKDWDLSGGIFACGDVEKDRERYGLWFHAMYDADNLYLLARFNDLTPLNNTGDTKLDFAWNGDSIQVRVVTAYQTPQQKAAVLNCWKGRDGADVIEFDSPPETKNSPKGDNIKPLGAQQAFELRGNEGYSQEIAVPWKLLTQDGGAPKPGGSIVLTIEPNFTLGATSRLSIKDIFRPGVPIDRVFTFMNSAMWGVSKLATQGKITPQTLRLSDGRQFNVAMDGQQPVVDWAGLVQVKQRPGFKPIQFTLPEEGVVSLVIRDSNGEIVRQLLTAERRPKGENTIQWDGLATYSWKTPGEPVAPGEYSWSALHHPGIGLKWRGFADHSGIVPWDNGPGTNWGGDMGPPDSVACDGDRVLLGWHASEAGKAAVLCDLQGHPIWSHKRGGFGGAPFVGLDAGVAYIVDHTVIYKLKVADGTIVPWTADGSGELSVRQLMGGHAGADDRLQGMAVKNGLLYVASSAHQFSRGDVKNWRDLFTQASGLGEADPARVVWNQLEEKVRTRVEAWLKTTGSDDQLQAVGLDPDARDRMIDLLNQVLTGTELGEMKNLRGAALVTANRRGLETKLPALQVRDTNFVAIIDAVSGKSIRKVLLVGAADLAANESGVFAIVDGNSVAYINGSDGTVKTVLRDLPQASTLAVDGAGNLYVGSASDHQVAMYHSNSKLVRTFGPKGGRSPTGIWQGNALRTISALAVDRDHKLWVGEANFTPQRFCTWNTRSGELIAEYFGPTHYGASGSSIFPDDPNVMVGEACEWQLDPKTGQSKCMGVFDDALHSFTRFVKGSNGRNYLAALGPSYIGGGFGINTIKIFERVAPGDYRLRARIQSLKPDQGDPKTEFWADSNNDSLVQSDEIQAYPAMLGVGGYYLWSMFMNADFALYLGDVTKNGQDGILQFKVTDFTAAGAPKYDLANAKRLTSATGVGGLSSLDNRWLLAGDNGAYAMIDVDKNRKLWSYFDQWFGVHGSHRAPAAEPGLLRGTFGIVGSARLPEPVGDIWALNSNLGEWHLLTRDGFYLDRLFQPDAIQFAFPLEAKPGTQVNDIPAGMGMEDFGGSLQQSPNGKIYVQAGKTALWNMEVTGLDQVRSLPGGKMTITLEDVVKAQSLRETLLQQVAGTRLVELKRATPQFTGNLSNDFAGVSFLEYKKTEDTPIRSAITYDDKNLYLGWDVKDPTPWINNADSPEYMYARGDSVDFQLGSDPSADPKRVEAVRGDLRLSIGQVAGKPVAVIYRKVANNDGDRKPHTFSSGIIREYAMESVHVVPDALILVKVDGPGKRYTVEAAIPLAVLGLQPTAGQLLIGDMGATHSNPSGDDTRLRTYWSNQETGLVDDEVFELMMKPANWGQLKF